jgi:hypothetical protein
MVYRAKPYHCKQCKRELFTIEGRIVVLGAIMFKLPRKFTFDCQYCTHENVIEQPIVKAERACYDTVVAPV